MFITRKVDWNSFGGTNTNNVVDSTLSAAPKSDLIK